MIHIHNGEVVAVLAQRSGIPGEHLAYREALITGPVVPGEDWIDARARAISARYGQELLRVRTDLMEQEQRLDAAPEEGEIVLWFEHDLYCLLHLVHLLDRFAEARVSVVWCPEPVANNDERGLSLLFESRAAATPAMLTLARDAWKAYTSPDATALNVWSDHDTPDFPFLREGLLLHASRFPAVTNGLGAVEQAVLELIAAGATEWLALFDQFNTRLPRFGFADAEILATLRDLAARPVPLVTMTGDEPKIIFALTPAGENVLRGEVDDLAINDPDRWYGGVHLTKENRWRWDGTGLSRSAAS